MPEDGNMDLKAVKIIKDKLCVKINGRICANVSKQKSYLKNGETISSPKDSTEVLLNILMIDSVERRDIYFLMYQVRVYMQICPKIIE